VGWKLSGFVSGRRSDGAERMPATGGRSVAQSATTSLWRVTFLLVQKSDQKTRFKEGAITEPPLLVRILPAWLSQLLRLWVPWLVLEGGNFNGLRNHIRLGRLVRLSCWKVRKGRSRVKIKEYLARRNRRSRDGINGWIWLAPSFLGVALFYIVPFFVIVYYSMIDNPIQRNFVFLDNFTALFQNRAFTTAAVNTLRFSVTAVPLAVVLALALALLLEARIPLKSQLRTFFLSPLMVPVASIVLIWQVLFHFDGAINEFLAIFGVGRIDWLQSEHNQLVVVILFLWKNLGFNMILFMAALSNIPRELLEVADVEGAGPVYKLFAVKFRYLSPTLLFVTILSLINSFKVFREAYLLTGDYPYGGLYMLQHFMNNIFRSLDYQRLASAAVVMAVAMVLIIAVLFIIENRFGKDVEG